MYVCPPMRTCFSHVNAHKQKRGTLLFLNGKGISKNKKILTHAHTQMHTGSLSNPSTNSPLVEGVHCFSFILISPLLLKKKKIHITFSLSWPQSEALKQSITLLMLFVSPDLSLSMESTPLSWSRAAERQTLTWGNCFLSQAILNPKPAPPPPLL